jgi:hypothetical protein
MPISELRLKKIIDKTTEALDLQPMEDGEELNDTDIIKLV